MESTNQPGTLEKLMELRLPVIAAPMFIASSVELVLAQCKAGVCGSFPALNARSPQLFDDWLVRISEGLDDPAQPYGVNLILHHSNDRLQADLDTCVRRKVPLLLTSQRSPDEAVAAAASYGGLVFHDVTTLHHAEKAVRAGVDGIILVCAGAGGHSGRLSPFALFAEVRGIFSGPIVLAGSISTGADILAAQALGASFVYMGTRFIATEEAAVPEGYKRMVIDAKAEDIIYTNAITGARANYLRPSLQAAGLDVDNLLELDPSKSYVASPKRDKPKAWKDIWSAGHGVGAISEVLSVSECVSRLESEYRAAKHRLDNEFARTVPPVELA